MIRILFVSILISYTFCISAQEEKRSWVFGDIKISFEYYLSGCGEDEFFEVDDNVFHFKGQIDNNYTGSLKVLPISGFDTIIVEERFVNSWGYTAVETNGYHAYDTTVCNNCKLEDLFAYSRWTPINQNEIGEFMFDHWNNPRTHWKPYKPKIAKAKFNKWVVDELCPSWECEYNEIMGGVKFYMRQLKIKVVSGQHTKTLLLKFRIRSGEC